MSLRDTFPGFMGQDGRTTRTALVRDGELSTLVVHGDSVTRDREHDLFEGGTAFPPTRHNDIRYYTDAREVFAEMGEQIAAAGAGDSIVLLGWSLSIHCELLRDAPDAAELGAAAAWRRPGRLGRMLVDAAQRGAKVVVILWAGSPNARHLVEVEGSSHALEHPLIKAALEAESANLRVVLDSHDHTIGAHHMKLLVVGRAARAVAFYGGMDLSTSRYFQGGWHDLHARVRGPLVRQLFDLATERFESALPTLEERAVFSAISAPPATDAPGDGSHARLTRTLIYRGRDAYDPRTDVEPFLRNAIECADRFIYVEDQYLWTLLEDDENGMMDAIAERLPALHHVTFVTNDDEVQNNEHASNRHAAISRLVRRAGSQQYKIGVYSHRGRFVHSKLWIVDDELVACGSANFAPRSYKFDTELMVGEVDRVGAEWHALGATHARRLRIAQWRRLLGIARAERLADPVAGVAYFRRLERLGDHGAGVEGARISNYSISGLPWRTAVREGALGDRSLIDRGANG